jgi:TonB family protein
MDRLILCAVFVGLITHSTSAQTSRTTYYKSYEHGYLSKEAPKEKAEYAELVIKNLDSVSTEIKNIRTGEVLLYEAYKGDEPIGVWKYKRENGVQELDYNFTLVYSDKGCPDSLVIPGIEASKMHEDNAALNYQAPVTPAKQPIPQFMTRAVYPSRAKESDISGKVYVAFTITKSGDIENITVKEGVHILLDKETVRTVKLLKGLTPAILNGEKKAVCAILPLAFVLQ